jgi:hypothetical protein
MRKLHFLLLLVSVCLAVACRQVLPKDRMVNLLTDMYLYEDELAKGIQGADSVSIYRSVFIWHGCTEEEYREAIACYAKKPKEMKEIYAAVKLRLEGYKAEFEQALHLENYLLTAPSLDTLYYIALDDDSTRYVYLPKFRSGQELPDSVIIVIPERPSQPEQLEPPGQPEQSEQPDKPVRVKQLDKAERPVRPERIRRSIHPDHSFLPAERLQPLP